MGCNQMVLRFMTDQEMRPGTIPGLTLSSKDSQVIKGAVAWLPAFRQRLIHYFVEVGRRYVTATARGYA